MIDHRVGEFNIRLCDGEAEQREAEASVLAAGYPLPISHRTDYAKACVAGEWWFLEIRDQRNVSQGGFALEGSRSRALPGHWLLRSERFGEGLAEEVREVALQALLELLAKRPRVLRLNIETFLRDAAQRERLGEAMGRLGFQKVQDAQHYRRTLAMDLTLDEAALFAGLHGTARRKIRAIARHPVEIRPIVDGAWGTRMNDLMEETLTRTGGNFRPLDWDLRIRTLRGREDLAVMLGLFRTDREGPGSLVAYATSFFNGTYAHYDASASTRCTDLKSLPLNYALMWEMIRWAKKQGATWYDFGGITAGPSNGEQDRLEGVSDFKRFFCQNEIEVGGEWMIEPRWLRARIANGLSAGAAWVRSLRPRGPSTRSAHVSRGEN